MAVKVLVPVPPLETEIFPDDSRPVALLWTTPAPRDPRVTAPLPVLNVPVPVWL